MTDQRDMLDWHRVNGHLWEMRPGKPTRCGICRKPVLPWHRRWRNRARTRVSVIQDSVWRWLR